MSAPTAPTFPDAGVATVVRKWIAEVDTTPDATPTWTMVGYISNFVFNPDNPNWEDDSDLQSGGYGSQTKTAASASAQFTIQRKTADGTSYDDGQEFLRTHAIGQFGPDNSVRMRFSEFTPGDGTPRIEAYTGKFGVAWEPQGGGNTALDTVQVTLNGQGACAAITHPYPAT